jgi:hypothetical protein
LKLHQQALAHDPDLRELTTQICKFDEYAGESGKEIGNRQKNPPQFFV